ncbi:hypothetical protein F383_03515 [Gossypium arboreum]|uniref:Uncharacterized protein n=1 Tax=Gossypium arboreum TaxID=29729 RepID=A0A0B0PQT0_GOSAR|nr:hypothetical protein F383_03515 [Gossypium arboreum]
MSVWAHMGRQHGHVSPFSLICCQG